MSGGFAAFSSSFPGLCESKTTVTLPLSLSQPCLPAPSVGPTCILTHLYLGSQKDVLNKDLMAQNGITYVLNASNTCPKPDFISDSHFMRIPVNDNYCEKLLPWLDKTNDFIDKAKVCNARVIVHCLAGISRSATIAIAYIMKTMGLSSDDAYRFVKDRRPSISPNFNFLGQLLEFEKGLSKGIMLKEDQGSARGQEVVRACEGSESVERSESTALQLGFNGLCLTSDRLLDTNRLKRSFSLDIKSVYAPRPVHTHTHTHTHSHTDTEDVPKLCKLDSPGAANGVCAFSPVADLPGSAGLPAPPLVGSGSRSGSRSGAGTEVRARARRKGKHVGSAGSSPVHSLSLNFSQSLPVQKSPSLGEESCRTPPLPSPGAMWTKHRDTVQATTPVTPTGEAPWYFGAESPVGEGPVAAVRFGSSSAYVAFGCSGRGGGGASDTAKPREKAGGSWHEEAPPTGSTPIEKQFKRRSCQMEFEEGISEGRSRGEELGKIGKQSSFSGSLEIIEVS